MPVNSGGGAVPAVRSGEQRSGAVLLVVRRGARARGRERPRGAQDRHRHLLRPDRLDRARGGPRPRAGPGRSSSRYFEAVAGTIRSFGGTVEKFIGDAVMAVFGTGRCCARTTRSARCGRRTRSASSSRPSTPSWRALIGFGARRSGSASTRARSSPARSRRGDFMVTGDTVNAAERLQRHAGPGEIVLGARDAPAQPARDPGRAARRPGGQGPQGRDHRVPPARDPGWVGSRPPRLRAPLVGRDAERLLLRSALERCTRRSLLPAVHAAGPARRRQVAARGRGAPAAGRAVARVLVVLVRALRRRGHAAPGGRDWSGRRCGSRARAHGGRDPGRRGDAARRRAGRRVDREPVCSRCSASPRARRRARGRSGRCVGCSRCSPASARSSSCSTTSTRPRRALARPDRGPRGLVGATRRSC